MSKRDDDELIGYIMTGLQMIARGAERAIQGNDRFWAYDDRYYRRRRPKADVAPAAPPEVVQPLISRIDRAAGEQAMAYETLLTAQEVADFLGLERVSVLHLVNGRHVDGIKVGSKILVSLGELRRYLDEGPREGVVARPYWRPLVEEFPGRRKAAELEVRTEVLRQKYNAVTVNDLRDILDIDWDVIDRLERKGIIKPFPVEEPNSWHMVKKADIPTIEAYIKEEEERRARRKAERTAQRKAAQEEPRIKL